MKLLSHLFILVGTSALTSAAFAQSSLEGFTTGRYEVRSSSKANKKTRAIASEAAPIVEPSATPVAVKPAITPEASPAVSPVAAASAAPAALPAKAVAREAIPAIKPPPHDVEEPDISEQAQSLFKDGGKKVYEFYQDQVHEDDIRNNRLEIELAPTAVYNDSSSNYSYRSYQSYFNSLKVKSNLWLTPAIGLTGQVLFSFGADVDSVTDSSRVGAKYEFIDLGLNFRKFFGMSRKSNSLEFSFLYNESKITPSSDNTSRGKLSSNGLGLGLKARFPISMGYAWVVGGNFFPRLQHDEGDTGLVLNSGSLDEASRMGLDLGGEWKFDRESQLIWNLGISTERDVFDGTASLPDPKSGSTPSNVSVTNSLYMFSLGYRWGH